jgi:HEAT repeat protein
MKKDLSGASNAYAPVIAGKDFNPDFVRSLCWESIDCGLASSEVQTRIAALRALKLLPANLVEGRLATALNDPSPDVRIAACNVAADASIKATVGVMKAMLQDSDEVVCAAAAEAMARMGNKLGLDTAKTILKMSNDNRARVAAINAIGLCGETDDMTTKRLNWALADQDLNVHNAAVIALVRLKDPAGNEAIKAAMAAFTPDAREWAANTVGSLRLASASAWLTNRLAEDQGAQVRVAAAAALGKLADRGAAGALKAALTDLSWPVRVKAARALDALGEKPETRIYEVGLTDESYEARVDAMAGLAAHDGPKALPRLEKLTSDVDSDVRLAAFTQIGKVAGKDAVPSLGAGLADSDPLVRLSSAALILKALGV